MYVSVGAEREWLKRSACFPVPTHTFIHTYRKVTPQCVLFRGTEVHGGDTARCAVPVESGVEGYEGRYEGRYEGERCE